MLVVMVTEETDYELCNASNRNIQGIGTGIFSQTERSQGCYGSDCHEGGCEQTMKTAVRRLTTIECTRLQGFPDDWLEIGDWEDENGRIRNESDSAKFKAIGNSIALPFWQWLARRIAAQYERPITMGSMFDGIGGFPLVFRRVGAEPVWASEIEPFCIAVTKKHFGDGEQEGDIRQYL